MIWLNSRQLPGSSRTARYSAKAIQGIACMASSRVGCGSSRVLRRETRSCSTSLDAGELFGEIALLDGSTRTASAAAMEQADLMRIHRDHFLPYVRANPDLLLNMLTLLDVINRKMRARGSRKMSF